MLAVLVAAATALLLATAPAAAQRAAVRRTGVHWRGGVPTIDVSVRDLANSTAVRRKLTGGLPQLLVVRVVAYPQRSSPKAIAPAFRSCRVVYDLWEETFRVELATDSSDKTVIVRSVDEVLDRCLVFRDMPVGRAADYVGRRDAAVYFAVLAELNPLSVDTVQRIRRWIARPSGDKMEGEAFFGSFVSLFVNQRIGQAERTIRFRSQPAPTP